MLHVENTLLVLLLESRIDLRLSGESMTFLTFPDRIRHQNTY